MCGRKKGDSMITIPDYESHTINEDREHVYIKIMSGGYLMTIKCKRKQAQLKDSHPLKVLDN